MFREIEKPVDAIAFLAPDASSAVSIRQRSGSPDVPHFFRYPVPVRADAGLNTTPMLLSAAPNRWLSVSTI